MATVTDTPTKANGAKTPARARKAPAKSTAKPAARKPAAPQSTAEKVVAQVAGSVKAAAEHSIKAAHVPETAKSVAAKVRATPARLRKAVSPAKKPATRKAAASAKRSTSIGTGTVIGVAAAGLAVGIAANLGRKAAVQAPSVMAGDWLEALKAEHKAALALLDKLARSTPEQPAKRTLLLAQLKHALGKHAFTEENVIYPALREWGDKADADALNHEQGYHKQYLYELDALDKGSSAFASKVADFRADLNAHIREEEDKIFPKIHAGLDADKNKALTGLANREGFKMA